MENMERTTQTIGNTQVEVVSHFKKSGGSVNDKIADLLKRETEAKISDCTIAKDGQTKYNKNASTV
jgi:hypothetical protein